MELTAEDIAKFAPTGNGVPVYLDDREPEIDDPARKPGIHEWQPACPTTSKLTRCLEAVRDISCILAPLRSAPELQSEKRLVKQIIIPVYNLAIAVRDLYNYVQANRWRELSKDAQKQIAKRFRQFGELVPTQKGVLKDARDKIAAHLDSKLCTTQYRQFWDAFDLDDLLRWIGASLRLFDSLLRPDIYAWSRSSGYSNVWNVMNVDGKEVSLLIEDQKPTEIVQLTLVVSPKRGIVREGRELVAICDEIQQRLSSSSSGSTEAEHAD